LVAEHAEVNVDSLTYFLKADITVVMTEHFAVKQGFDMSDTLTKNEYITALALKNSETELEFKNRFWEEYNPSKFWYVTLASGIFAMLLLFLYDRYILKEKVDE
jgi:hypothetical protein